MFLVAADVLNVKFYTLLNSCGSHLLTILSIAFVTFLSNRVLGLVSYTELTLLVEGIYKLLDYSVLFREAMPALHGSKPNTYLEWDGASTSIYAKDHFYGYNNCTVDDVIL